MKLLHFLVQLGISESQLTNSYFSEGLKPPTSSVLQLCLCSSVAVQILPQTTQSAILLRGVGMAMVLKSFVCLALAMTEGAGLWPDKCPGSGLLECNVSSPFDTWTCDKQKGFMECKTCWPNGHCVEYPHECALELGFTLYCDGPTKKGRVRGCCKKE